MAQSSYRQSFATIFTVLLFNQAVADPLVTGLVQAATKEVVRNWVQSRARRSLAEELSATAKTLGNEISLGAQSMIVALAMSPFLLPLWLPLMLLGSAFFVTTLAPTMLPGMVKNLTPMLNHLSLLLSSLGFEDASRTLEPKKLSKLLEPGELLERGLDVLNVKESECRHKMFCEIGSYTLDKQPAMARFMDLFSETFSRALPTYASTLLKGIRGADCAKHFDKCDISPFGKVLNYYYVA